MRNPRSQSFSSFSSILVWTGENDTKPLVWMKIFCFVFDAIKTDTFENALVWMGPRLLKDKSLIRHSSRARTGRNTSRGTRSDDRY